MRKINSTPINYIDFSKLPKYEKKKSQVLPAEEVRKELTKYFKNNKKPNYFYMALHFNMSTDRFERNYLNSKDEEIRELAQMGLNALTAFAMAHEEDYKRTLRYIMARQNTGKDFIELDDKVLDANANKVIILPPKKVYTDEPKDDNDN